MSKVILGQRPAYIPARVEARMPDGSPVTVAVRYRYRTRREYAEFIDSFAAGRNSVEEPAKPRRGRKGSAPAAEEQTAVAEPLNYHEVSIRANVDLLAEILDGWDLDVPLNRETLDQLADEAPGIAAALIEGYGLAIHQGRLGN